MNPLISELVASERLAIIQSQVDIVLPKSSARPGRRLPSGDLETEDIEVDAILLSAYIAHWEYDVPVPVVAQRIGITEQAVRLHIGWLRDQIQEGKDQQWIYRYRAALYFLRTWRPAPAQTSNRSLKAQKHEDAILSGR